MQEQNRAGSNARGVGSGLVIWLALAVWVGASGAFSHTTPKQVAATVWGLVALVFLGIWLLPALREFARSVDPRALMAIHLTRFVGVAFVVLYLSGCLPRSFGLMGGTGDIVAALGAATILIWCKPVIAPASRKWVLVWNVSGMVDIVAVVASALREGLRDPALMAPLRQFPLSLLPTFVVPLIIVSHVLIFVRLRKSF